MASTLLKTVLRERLLGNGDRDSGEMPASVALSCLRWPISETGERVRCMVALSWPQRDLAKRSCGTEEAWALPERSCGLSQPSQAFLLWDGGFSACRHVR